MQQRVTPLSTCCGRNSLPFSPARCSLAVLLTEFPRAVSLPAVRLPSPCTPEVGWGGEGSGTDCLRRVLHHNPESGARLVYSSASASAAGTTRS